MAKYDKGKHPNSKKNLNMFVKGKSGNPNGRPKKLTNDIINDLYQKGYDRLSQSQVIDCYLTILNLPKSELELIVKDSEAPVILKIVIERILSKRGFEAIESLLMRSLGQPKQEMEIKSHVREIPMTSASEYLKAIEERGNK